MSVMSEGVLTILQVVPTSIAEIRSPDLSRKLSRHLRNPEPPKRSPYRVKIEVVQIAEGELPK